MILRNLKYLQLPQNNCPILFDVQFSGNLIYGT
jgi:hypothetical protein